MKFRIPVESYPPDHKDSAGTDRRAGAEVSACCGRTGEQGAKPVPCAGADPVV